MVICLFFFFNDTATTEIYTLSLHDALPILRCCSESWRRAQQMRASPCRTARWKKPGDACCRLDRKSTRLNSSHSQISYAVFCLEKKKQDNDIVYELRLNILRIAPTSFSR